MCFSVFCRLLKVKRLWGTCRGSLKTLWQPNMESLWFSSPDFHKSFICVNNNYFHYRIICLLLCLLFDLLFCLWNVRKYWKNLLPTDPRRCIHIAYFIWIAVQNPKIFSIHYHTWQRKESNPHIWEVGTRKCLTFMLKKTNKKNPTYKSFMKIVNFLLVN